MKNYFILVLFMLLVFVGIRGITATAENHTFKVVTGHSITSDGVISNKEMYNLAVKNGKIMCRQFGKVWCDKNYAKGIAEAKKEFLDNQ